MRPHHTWLVYEPPIPSFLDGSSGPSASLEATGCFFSNWVDIQSSLKDEVSVRLISLNYVSQSVISGIYMEFK